MHGVSEYGAARSGVLYYICATAKGGRTIMFSQSSNGYEVPGTPNSGVIIIQLPFFLSLEMKVKNSQKVTHNDNEHLKFQLQL